MTISARVTSKGQITLPAELRKALGLKPGDTVDFRKTEGGDYQLVAKRYTLADLRGMIKLQGRETPSVGQIVEDVKAARLERAAEIAKKSAAEGAS